MKIDNDTTDANILDFSVEEYIEWRSQRSFSEDREDCSGSGDEKTLQDVIDTMNEEPQNALYAVVASVMADCEGDPDFE